MLWPVKVFCTFVLPTFDVKEGEHAVPLSKNVWSLFGCASNFAGKSCSFIIVPSQQGENCPFFADLIFSVQKGNRYSKKHVGSIFLSEPGQMLRVLQIKHGLYKGKMLFVFP